MAIKAFIVAILIFGTVTYFIPIDNTIKRNNKADTPFLIFKDSTMYTLTPENMNRIVYSKEVLRFKLRDVMHSGALTLKGKDKNNSEITDVLYSDVIIKRGDKFSFLNNVKYKRNDYISLETDELIYDSKSKIATNTLPFEGRYFNDYIKGKDIYLDLNKYYMKAKNTHFEIEVRNNKKDVE